MTSSNNSEVIRHCLRKWNMAYRNQLASSPDLESRRIFFPWDIASIRHYIYISLRHSPFATTIDPQEFVVCVLKANRQSSDARWLYYVMCNQRNFSHICDECAGRLKKLDLRSGSQRHRHFVGFFNVPVQEPTRDQHFYTVIPIHRPQLVAFYDTLGIRRTHSRLNPRALMGAHWGKTFVKLIVTFCKR